MLLRSREVGVKTGDAANEDGVDIAVFAADAGCKNDEDGEIVARSTPLSIGVDDPDRTLREGGET